MDETGNLISRFELCRDDVMAEFALISTDNGYRTAGVKVVNAIRRQDQIIQSLVTGQAEIGIQIGNVTVEGQGTNWQSYDALANIWVQGVIQAQSSSKDASVTLNTALEGLRHDFLKVCNALTMKYVNNYKGRWNIQKTPIQTTVATDLGGKENVGAIGLKFQAHLRFMDGTFK